MPQRAATVSPRVLGEHAVQVAGAAGYAKRAFTYQCPKIWSALRVTVRSGPSARRQSARTALTAPAAAAGPAASALSLG